MRSKRAERKEKFDSEKTEINKGKNFPKCIEIFILSERYRGRR